MGAFQGGCGSGCIDVCGIHPGAQEAQYTAGILFTLSVCSTPPCAPRPGGPSPGDRSLHWQPPPLDPAAPPPQIRLRLRISLCSGSLGLPKPPHYPSCFFIVPHSERSSQPPFLPIVFHPISLSHAQLNHRILSLIGKLEVGLSPAPPLTPQPPSGK